MNQHLKDTFRHKGKRKLLVEELGKMGIEDPAILSAFNAIPRHYFLDLAFDEQDQLVYLCINNNSKPNNNWLLSYNKRLQILLQYLVLTITLTILQK